MTNENLFMAANNNEVAAGNHLLNATAELTSLATQIANEILQTVTSDASYAEDVKASQQEHSNMDKLIELVYPLAEVDIQFLNYEKEDVADKMIRSQQSKRSRAKGKPMTQENYRTMLVGAISENLLRIAFNKPKGVYSGLSTSGEVTYTEEQLEALANDPIALGKAIRNVQSKKSIEKSKEGFDVEGERWVQLLVAESQLKEIRNQANGLATAATQQAVEAKDKAAELLASADLGSMNAKDAKALLAELEQTLATK